MFCWLEIKFKRFIVLIIFHWTYYSTQRCMMYLNNYIGDPYIHMCCGRDLRYRRYEQLAIVVYCTAASVLCCCYCVVDGAATASFSPWSSKHHCITHLPPSSLLKGPPGSQPSPHAQPPPHNPNNPMMGPHGQVRHTHTHPSLSHTLSPLSLTSCCIGRHSLFHFSLTTSACPLYTERLLSPSVSPSFSLTHSLSVSFCLSPTLPTHLPPPKTYVHTNSPAL